MVTHQLKILASALLLTFTGSAQQLIPVTSNGKYGFTRNGELVIQPVYDYAADFSEGLALVRQGKLWGYINPTGKTVVAPEFTSAEPVHNGVALVYKGKKWGLIRASGERLLEPVYDSMHLDFNQSNFIYRDGFKGWCNSDFTFVTPMIYRELIDHYDFLSGKKQNGKWDLYWKGKLILEDLQSPVDYKNFLWNSSVAFLRKNDHYGVYRPDEGWLFQPVFDTILEFPVERYTIPDNYFDKIYLLGYRSEVKDNVGFPLSDFNIMLGDGKLLSPNHYHSIWPVDNSVQYNQAAVIDFPSVIYLSGDQSTTVVSSDLRLKEIPYPNVVEHLNWYIVEEPANGKQCILDSKLQKTACFDRIEQPRNYYYHYAYDGDTIPYDSSFVIEYLPYLYVSSTIDGQLKTALYSLEEKRIVSPFMQAPRFKSQFEGSTDTWGFTYAANGSEGFFFPGMKMGTDLKFKKIGFLWQHQFSSVNPKNGYVQIWKMHGDQLELFIEDYSIELEAWGAIQREYVYSDQVTRFDMLISEPPYRDFIRTSNEDGKYGFICANGVRIPDSYDSVLQNASVEYFIDTYRDGLYGAVNFFTGEVIQPAGEIPLRILHSDMSNIDYALIEKENEAYYVDKKGKFFGTVDETAFSTFKRNGKTGLQMQSEFNGDTIEVIPPIYKKLKYTTDVNEMVLFEATGENGKKGFVNQRGDTIIPLEYNSFKHVHFYTGGGLISRKGKKTGLVSFCHGVLVPPIFDEWEENYNVMGSSDGFLVRKACKVGLYSYTGKQLLPCVYEDFRITYNYSQFSALQVLQNEKWYVQYYFLSDLNKFDCTRSELASEPVDTAAFFGPFDLVVGNAYYRKTASGTYSQYAVGESETLLNEAIAESEITVTRQDSGVVLFVENGKIGARSEDGKVLVKPAFTNVMLSENGSLLISEGGTNFMLDPYTNKRTKFNQ